MGYGPWDVAKDVVQGNVEFVNTFVKDARLAICKACEHYRPMGPVGGQCAQCGCYLQAKATLARATCPLNKWEK